MLPRPAPPVLPLLGEIDGSSSPDAARPITAETARAHSGERPRGQVGTRRVIGYLERVALPRWGTGTLTAKMDTGADTSALHVGGLERRGTTRVSFLVLWDGGAAPQPVQARIVRLGWVRSSNGDEEERIFVRTSVTLAGVSRMVEFGLCDRSRMQQRMLLGRSALEGAYLIDPSRAHLSEGAFQGGPRAPEWLTGASERSGERATR